MILAMVSGRGRMDTYRSSRARAARRTAASWSRSITRRRTACVISGTDIVSTTGANSASTRPRSSRVRHRVSVIAARTPRSDTRPAANACSVAGISVDQRPGVGQPARRRRRGRLGGETDLVRDPQPPPPHRHTLRLPATQVARSRSRPLPAPAPPPTLTSPVPATRSDRSAPHHHQRVSGLPQRRRRSGHRSTHATPRRQSDSVICNMCSILIRITDNPELSPSRQQNQQTAGLWTTNAATRTGASTCALQPSTPPVDGRPSARGERSRYGVERRRQDPRSSPLNSGSAADHSRCVRLDARPAPERVACALDLRPCRGTFDPVQGVEPPGRGWKVRRARRSPILRPTGCE